MPATFDAFFSSATGNPPYDYQSRLAGGDAGRACESQLISIPTGLGKTAAVVLAWLWNRVHLKRADWPRRLVICLPMRTLVEQTCGEAEKWLNNLAKLHPENIDLQWIAKHSPILLMGGEENDSFRREWDVHPERPAILIGTQDMLLSRALNRGYGMARARWPMHFGLLNNDALWVMDEVQLMDVGLATSAQLQTYRLADHEAGKILRPCITWWMSATLQPAWLESVDTRPMVTSLRSSIVEIPREQKRGGIWDISKPCEVISLPDEKKWAPRIWEEHVKSTAGDHGRITLVIVNTVRTARKLHTALLVFLKKRTGSTTELRLVHSRFRPHERRCWRESFLNRAACTGGTDRIIIATQIVEAGVDISATTLFTQLAPWPSLVQRFGRAARYGGSARIFVIDGDPTEKTALPYTLEDLIAARAALCLLPDASLAGLAAFEHDHPETFARLFPYAPLHLLLRRELEELFDTTPDLSGADLDISRFIRSGEERDVLVFWKDLPAKITPAANLVATREELCPVPIGDARDWLVKGSAKGHAWVWDYLDGRWRKCVRDDIYPGQTILVGKSAGGYDPDFGWTGDPKDCAFTTDITLLRDDIRRADASAQSDQSSQDEWQTIAHHSTRVAQAAATISAVVDSNDALARLLQIAARWHDLGKAHPAFQSSIISNATGHLGTLDIAKAPRTAWRRPTDFYRLSGSEQRLGFRHELASTLALFAILIRHQPFHAALLGPHRDLLRVLELPELASSAESPATPLEQEILELDQDTFDLLAYIICSHHGKVRTAWHTTPADQSYRGTNGVDLPIHGIREGDSLPPVSLTMANGEPSTVATGPLTLEPARIGFSPRTGSSWAERAGMLLTKHGPFNLAYIETLFRAADARASQSSSTDGESPSKTPATTAP